VAGPLRSRPDMPPPSLLNTDDGDWELLEIEVDGACPCSDALASASDHERALVDRKLRLVAAAGMPPDPERGRYVYERAGRYDLRRKGVRITVYVLKCKPGPWRLYFYRVPGNTRQIEFLHAVQKKGRKRDPQDFKICCRLVDRIDEGTAECRRFGPGQDRAP